jgi:hypothetical protein
MGLSLRGSRLTLMRLYVLQWHASEDKPEEVDGRTCRGFYSAHCGGSAEADEEADVRKRKRGNRRADAEVQKLALQIMVLPIRRERGGEASDDIGMKF